jgi:cell wall-associated NlpC family hydrolase
VSIADALAQIQAIQQQIAQVSGLTEQVPGTGDFASLLATAQNGAAATPSTTTATGTYATDPTATTATTAATATTAIATSGTAEASPYDSMIVQAAQANGVDPALLKALVRAESNFNPNAVSGAGAIGLTQLMPGTAAGLGVQNAYDPMQNLMGGARYLHNALQQFNGDESLALASYNAGSGAVRKYGGIPPYAETQAYVPRVLGYARQLRAEGFGGATPTATATTAAMPGSAASLAVQGATQAAASPGAQTAISVAQQFLGTPYKWGGSSPSTGFDCSGLVQYAYGQAGVKLPRVAADQFDVGTPIDRNQLQPGDIVFFKDSSGYVHHEGLYLGGGKFLHAPHTGDVVKISSLDEPYYAGQFAGGRRVA